MQTAISNQPLKTDSIKINGLYFVRNAKLLVSSLFNASGTASGIFSVRKNGVLLSAPNGDPRVFVVNNRHNEQFLVSCHRAECGRIRYMFGLSSLDAQFLGLPDSKMSTDRLTAQAILAQLT